MNPYYDNYDQTEKPTSNPYYDDFDWEDHVSAYKKKPGIASRVASTMAKVGRQAYQSVGEGAGDAMLGIATQIEHAPILPPPHMTLGQTRDWGKYHPETVEAVKRGDTIGKNELSDMLRTASEAYPGVEEGRPLGVISDMINGILHSAPSIPLTKANPVAGLMLIYAHLAGNKYKQYIEEGKDEDTAFKASQINAIINAPIELAGNVLQIGKIVKILDTKGISKALGPKAKMYLKTILENALIEGSEELLQEQGNLITDEYANNPDADPVELANAVSKKLLTLEHAKRSGQAFGVGFGGSVLMTGAGVMGRIGQDVVNKKGWIGKESDDIIAIRNRITQKGIELGRAPTQEEVDQVVRDYRDSSDLEKPELIASVNEAIAKQEASEPIDVLEVARGVPTREQQIARDLEVRGTVPGFQPISGESAQESARVFEETLPYSEGIEQQYKRSQRGSELLKRDLALQDPYLQDIAFRIITGEQLDLTGLNKQDLRSIEYIIEQAVQNLPGGGTVPVREGMGLVTERPVATEITGLLPEEQRKLPAPEPGLLPAPPTDVGPGGQFEPLRRSPIRQESSAPILMGELSKGDDPKNYTGKELRQIAKERGFEIPKNMVKKSDMIEFIKSKPIEQQKPIKVQRSSEEAGDNTLYEIIEGENKGSSIVRANLKQTPEKYDVDETLMPAVTEKAKMGDSDLLLKDLERLRKKPTKKTEDTVPEQAPQQTESLAGEKVSEQPVEETPAKETEVIEKPVEEAKSEIIATSEIHGNKYEYRIAKFSDTSMPQMKYQIEFRKVGSDTWENSLLGYATSRKYAKKIMSERFYRMGDINELKTNDEELKRYIDKEVSFKKGKEREEQEKEKIRNQEAEQSREDEQESLDFIESIKAENLPGKKGVINIALRKGGTEQREATIYGDYAIFKEHERYGEYNITHIPTGMNAAISQTITEARLIAKAFNKYIKIKGKPTEKDGAKGLELLNYIRDKGKVPDFIKEAQTPAKKSEATQEQAPEIKPKTKQTPGQVYLDKGGVKYFNTSREIKKGLRKGKIEVTLTNGNRVIVRPEQIRRMPGEAVFLKESGDKNLFVVHNLTSANLKHADKVGGLAMPSLAISKKELPLTGFGEISLIAKPETLEDKTIKTLNADAYSPRYPKRDIVYDIDHDKVLKAANEVASLAKELKTSEYSVFASLEDDGLSSLYHEDVIKYKFLKDNNIPTNFEENDIAGDKRSKLYEIISKREEEFKDWVDKTYSNLIKSEKLFKGFTDAGYRKYLPHNLDSVVKLMKEQLKEGESFHYGVPSIRSKVAKRFRTVNQIQADRNKIISTENMEKIKEEVNQEFSVLANKFAKHLSFSKDFGSFDIVSDHFKEAIEKGFNYVNKEYYDGNLSADLIRESADFLDKLRNLPTEYFEAKVQRAMGLNEFVAAIVPEGTSQDVIDILNKNGISDIKYYEKDNEADRKRAISEVDSDLFFLKEADLKADQTYTDRLTGTKKTGITLKGVQNVVGRVNAAFPNIGKIEVLAKQADIPEEIIKSGGIESTDKVFAYYDPASDTIYVISENMNSPDAVIDAILHEGIGHRGIDAILTKENRRELFEMIERDYKDTDIGKKIIKDYRLDLGKLKDRVTFSREVIAHMTSKPKATLLDRVVAFIKDIIRKFRPSLKVTDSEIKSLLRRSAEFAREGQDAGVSEEIAYSQETLEAEGWRDTSKWDIPKFEPDPEESEFLGFISKETPEESIKHQENAFKSNRAINYEPPVKGKIFQQKNIDEISSALLAAKEGKIDWRELEEIVYKNIPLPPIETHGSGVFGDIYGGTVKDNILHILGLYLENKLQFYDAARKEFRVYPKEDVSKRPEAKKEDYGWRVGVGSLFKTKEEAEQNWIDTHSGGPDTRYSSYRPGGPYYRMVPESYDKLIKEFRDKPLVFFRNVLEFIEDRNKEDKAGLETIMGFYGPEGEFDPDVIIQKQQEEIDKRRKSIKLVNKVNPSRIVFQMTTIDDLTKDLHGEITKESKLAKRTEAEALVDGMIDEGWDNLVSYKTKPEWMKTQSEKAVKFLNENWEKAKKIALGEETSPEGIEEGFIWKAVKLRAFSEGNDDLVYQLATESGIPELGSKLGQRIKAFDESSNIEDPEVAIREVGKFRKDKNKRQGKKVVSVKKIKELKEKLDEAEAKLKEYEGKTEDENIDATIDRLIEKSPKRLYKKTNSRILKEQIKNSLDQGLSEISTDIQALAKYFITQGVTERNALVKEVHNVIKDIIPGITIRETMDAILGYGKFKPLNKDEILGKSRDLRAQLQQVEKLKDTRKDKTPSDEERRLIKQVEEMKKELGIETIDPEKQLKSSLDAVKTRLTNEIKDLEYQIATKQKIVKARTNLKYDAEANRLQKRRDDLKKQFHEIFGSEITDQQRINAAIKATEKAIVEYTRMINENDLMPKAKRTPVQSEELNKARKERDRLKAQVKELRDLAKPKRTPEEIATQRLETRLKNEIKKLTAKLENLDLKKDQRQETVLSAEGRKLKAQRDDLKTALNAAIKASGIVTREEASRLIELSRILANAREEAGTDGYNSKYGAAKVAFLEYIDFLKGTDKTIKEMLTGEWEEVRTIWKDNKAKAFTKSIMDIIRTVSDLSISLLATLDNSFLGRQGLNTLLTRPSIWLHNSAKSFVDIYKTMESKHGGEMVKSAVMADAYSRPNYRNGDYDIAKLIPKTEEQFPTSIPERVPFAGRLFKASENAFTNSGIRMRIDTYDFLKKIAIEQGIDVKDKLWIQETGKLINSITARGDLGRLGSGGPLRLIFWAPKMLWGNVNVLTAHFGGAGLKHPFARQQARRNLLKIVGYTVLIAAIADAIGRLFGKDDVVEWNPTSSDFMKIKVNNTRHDITAGKGSIITLLARALTFRTKSTKTKRITKLNSGKFGSRSLFDVIIDFMANKSAPLTKTAIDIARGRNFDYEKPGIGNVAYNLATPIGVQNFVETYQRADELKDIPVEEIIADLLDLVGINTDTYDSDVEMRRKYRALRRESR